jgi:hypothetical protein
MEESPPHPEGPPTSIKEWASHRVNRVNRVFSFRFLCSQAACFSLAGADGAEYALAGYDARVLLASSAGQPSGTLADPRYTISDATNGAGRAWRSRPPRPRGARG